ncbi:MAG: hypothetical protein AB1805_07790 [Nitrospirota bacterium]
MLRQVMLVTAVALLAAGCAGRTTTMYMKDAQAKETAVEFPNGTVLGGASKEQASTLARLFVDSHNMAMQEMADVRLAHSQMLKGQDEMKKFAQHTDARLQQFLDSTERLSRKSSETAEAALRMLEQLSKKQGTGEITVFFPTGVSRVSRNSLEYNRLVSFADYIARESRGRKVLLISIGCASATGSKNTNMRLARNRAEYPVDVIRKYLINTPHEFYKVYGVGDIYSPQSVSMKEHERYQHARLIAVFEDDDAIELPVEPMEHF